MIIDRNIRYMDYLVGGDRIGSVGYVNLTEKEAGFWLDIKISGLYDTDSYEVSVYGGNRENEWMLTRLMLGRGCGESHLFYKREDPAAPGKLAYLRVPLSTNRMLYCTICEEPATQALSAADREQIEEQEVSKEQEPAKEREAAKEQEPAKEREAAKEQEPVKGREAVMAETKWEYLEVIYEHIKPFEDGREYLIIGLSDFLIFSWQSYRLVHNSFLLHGFYNYHHLILGRKTGVANRSEFFVGVPGVYYEKEKQVARLYGCVRFEGKADYAKAGDFGYYLIPVQL